MSKVIYEETYGLWTNKNGQYFGTKSFPMCPKCKEPTYNEDKCPFCGEELEYE